MAATDEADPGPDVPADRPETLATPLPDLSPEEAGELAGGLFGVAGRVSPLASERDQNFHVATAERSFVLKVSNPAEDAAAIDMQTQALVHVARADPGLPIPRVRRTSAGERYAVLERKGRRHLVHMLTFLEGSELGPASLGPDALQDLGATVARTGRALRGFIHPAAVRVVLWDVKHAARLRPLVAYVSDQDRSALVARVLDGFAERVLPALPGLRAQVVHGDLTLTNVLFDSDGRVTGILDFGDVTHSALVCDLAVALAAVLRGGEETFDRADAVVRGYRAITELEEDEAAVLPDAIAARLAATVVISAWRARRFPGNAAYITSLDADTWPVLELFDELGVEGVRRRLSRARAPVVAWRAGAPYARAGGSADELPERRRRLLGSALVPPSYDRPLHMVRAEGVWMFDADGRRYLDAYNNVPVVGHSHPRVLEAVAKQARLLNTNSRYLHEAALVLAERLTATMPAGLDTCLFVNSGSEANDLAWRLASAVSGGTGAIVSARAYHGVTAALTDLSPSEWPDGERPAHVETLSAPDGYRGPHRREEPGWAERYAAAVEQAAAGLRRRGYAPAAMFLDPAWTSDGIFPDATGYLPEAVRRAHEAGALFVSDEVQAGFGRVGSAFWSFQRSGARPDLVTLGKPMGNGHPVAALVTRAEIADEFSARRRPLFSTFGGNPVSCAAALAVLDVIEEEGLMPRAAEVGAYLRTGLEDLARRHDLVGDVRGAGLLVGVELARDPETRAPAPEAARAVANGMRERGVLIGTTGRDDNVLKIRPPLSFGREDADQLVKTLDGVLTEVERQASG